MWHWLWSKVTFPLRARRFERELSEELRFHTEMLEADHRRAGLGPEEAAVRARAKMGSLALSQEDAREAWLIGWLDAFARDVRYTLRVFARQKVFTAVAVLTLALGIGANTAIFRVVDAVMLRMLPVSRPDQLLVMRGVQSYPRFRQLRDRNEVFSSIIGVNTLRSAELSVNGQSIGRGAVELVTGNYFSFLGVGTRIGRPLTPDDDAAPEISPVAVISHGFWTRAFGASPDVLGRTVQIRGATVGNVSTAGFEAAAPSTSRPDATTLTIVGVAPPEFFGDTVGTAIDVWTPLMMQPALMPGRTWLTRSTAAWIAVMGRLRPGVTEEQARDALTRLVRQIRTDDLGSAISEADRADIARTVVIVESGEKGFAQLRREFSRPLLVLMVVVGLVLIIACLNVANLLLARATARQQEISVRLSLGASRSRLVRQLMTESVVLAAAGGALGVLFAEAGTRTLVALVSSESRHIALAFDRDWRVLAFAVIVSLASGVLFGLAPAWRGTDATLQSAHREGTRSTGHRGRMTRVLVTAQVAVSLVLLIGAGLFIRTLYNLQAQVVGYDPEALVLMGVDPIAAGYRGDDIGRACVELMQRLAALPGVRTVTFSENGLFTGTESASEIEVDGFAPAARDDRNTRFDQVGPRYFTNVGIPLLLGRDIDETDGPGRTRVAVINETMARFYFPQGNPIGRHFRAIETPEVELEVVGVARDARDHGFRQPPVRRFYVSYLQPIDGVLTAHFAIRATSTAESIVGALRSETQRFNRNLPIFLLKPVRAQMNDSIVSERLVARLSTWLAALAVLLAAIGLYGVLSYMVARRTNEIGLRMALGARQTTVAMMVLRETIGLIVGGAVAGWIAAFGLSRYIASLMFGLAAHDAATYGAAAAILLTVGLLAAYLPARRAARIDPVVALRES
jgi:predicted permease